MEAIEYKNVIIGSGEAGKFLGWTQAKLGEKTVVIERGLLGGACPNVACLPSKNVIYSAKVAQLTRNGSEFGVVTEGMRVEMGKVTARKKAMVAGLAKLHLDNFAASGAGVLRGEASFVDAGTVRVALRDGGEKLLKAERVFLNLGSRASLPDVPGMKEAEPLTHVEALNLERLPTHLIVMGGGYVGLEFAQAMRRFGSQVTVIQHGKQLLDREDPDVAAAVQEVLMGEGIEILVNANVVRVAGKSGEQVTVTVEMAGEAREVSGSDLLAATGRTPNTDRVGVEKAGVQLDAHGFIKVDDKLRTTAKNVWAMGDCAGSPFFTHVSLDDFRIVRDTLAGKERSKAGRVIPYVLFTDPELAHIGLSETEAAAKGIQFRVAKIPMAAVLRTRTIGETRGFAKVLIGEGKEILGFTAFGVDVSEMLAIVQTAMVAKLPIEVLANMIFTHPSMGEGVGSLFGKVLAEAK